jgi:hypothetical protein
MIILECCPEPATVIPETTCAVHGKNADGVDQDTILSGMSKDYITVKAG